MFKPINIHQKVLGVEVYFLYKYDAFIKKLIYQYKGCYDVVLKDVFLIKHKKYIQKYYKDYILVYPPSNEKEDKKRGFNHIQEICNTLKIKSLDLFYKSIEVKQSNLNYYDRKNIENVIKVKPNVIINKTLKYLIIDDIFTSGSTLKTIIKLLINNGVNKENIKALIISKT